MIVLEGPVPSKKNLYRRSKNGGFFLNKQVSADIDALIVQAKYQWRGRAPTVHPALTIQFYVKSWRQDRDGMLATVLDVIQKAGIIRNDNTKWFNGGLVIMPSIKGTVQRTEIEFEDDLEVPQKEETHYLREFREEERIK